MSEFEDSDPGFWAREVMAHNARQVAPAATPDAEGLVVALERGIPSGPAAIHFCPWPGCGDIWESEASCIHAQAIAAVRAEHGERIAQAIEARKALAPVSVLFGGARLVHGGQEYDTAARIARETGRNDG